MWKVFIVAVTAIPASKVSAGALSDGYKQMGSPFRFDKHVTPSNLNETSAEIWWPAKGRATLHRTSKTKLDEALDVAMYTENSFPNPFEHPERCVSFPSLSHSWLCDPDKVLQPDEQQFIEAHLTRLRDTTESKCDDRTNFYQAAVAVASDIVVNENETPQAATDRFGNSLLKKWGVGNRGCHDGIVLTYIRNLKTFSIATRENVDNRVANPSFKAHLQKTVNGILAVTGSSAAAVAASVQLLNGRLPHTTPGMSWTATILLSLSGIYIASVGCVYYSLSSYIGKRFAAGEQ